MSLEDIDYLCEEVLHLSWILEEMHHFSKYDLEKVRYEYHQKLIELKILLQEETNREWFKNQTKSDKIIIGGG